MTLEDLGWNAQFAAEFAPHAANGLVPARLIRDNRITYGALIVEKGKFEELEVITCGKLYHDAKTDAALPAVGDWVALDIGKPGEDTVIRARLPRQTCFSRKAPGNATAEQVLVANVTTVVVVTEAGPDFNARRLERYFMLIARSGAKPVVLVNKSDLFTPLECKQAVEEIQALCPDAEVHPTSALTRKGFKPFIGCFKKGQTVALIGSSGVGKSALINQLLGDEYQWTGEVNEVTGRGRHTTTARELMVLRKGGIVVDNPGIKEVQLWTDEQTLRERFEDISTLAAGCQFFDCKHTKDRGCAVRAAVETGTLTEDRYRGFLKLDDEIAELAKLSKKRQMTLERRTRRDGKQNIRNKVDREEHQKRMKPRRHLDYTEV
jgi:ribosome biogenesis GTPase / thiamine phosphate phosphatase